MVLARSLDSCVNPLGKNEIVVGILALSYVYKRFIQVALRVAKAAHDRRPLHTPLLSILARLPPLRLGKVLDWVLTSGGLYRRRARSTRGLMKSAVSPEGVVDGNSVKNVPIDYEQVLVEADSANMRLAAPLDCMSDDPCLSFRSAIGALSRDELSSQHSDSPLHSQHDEDEEGLNESGLLDEHDSDDEEDDNNGVFLEDLITDAFSVADEPLSDGDDDQQDVPKSGKVTERFERDGDDLVYTHTLTLAEAICGTQFTIATLDGRQLAVSEDRASPQHVKVIPGEGMFSAKRRCKGDLKIKYNIVFPDLAQRLVLSETLKPSLQPVSSPK